MPFVFCMMSSTPTINDGHLVPVQRTPIPSSRSSHSHSLLLSPYSGYPFLSPSNQVNGPLPDGYSLSECTFRLGQRILVDGGKHEGVLKFYGPVKFQKGLWAGIELDNPQGKNNGAVDGVQYFHCPEKHGIFVSVHRITHSSTSPITSNKIYNENHQLPDNRWMDMSIISSNKYDTDHQDQSTVSMNSVLLTPSKPPIFPLHNTRRTNPSRSTTEYIYSPDLPKYSHFEARIGADIKEKRQDQSPNISLVGSPTRLDTEFVTIEDRSLSLIDLENNSPQSIDSGLDLEMSSIEMPGPRSPTAIVKEEKNLIKEENLPPSSQAHTSRFQSANNTTLVKEERNLDRLHNNLSSPNDQNKNIRLVVVNQVSGSSGDAFDNVNDISDPDISFISSSSVTDPDGPSLGSPRKYRPLSEDTSLISNKMISPLLNQFTPGTRSAVISEDRDGRSINGSPEFVAIKKLQELLIQKEAFISSLQKNRLWHGSSSVLLRENFRMPTDVSVLKSPLAIKNGDDDLCRITKEGNLLKKQTEQIKELENQLKSLFSHYHDLERAMESVKNEYQKEKLNWQDSYQKREKDFDELKKSFGQKESDTLKEWKKKSEMLAEELANKESEWIQQKQMYEERMSQKKNLLAEYAEKDEQLQSHVLELEEKLNRFSERDLNDLIKYRQQMDTLEKEINEKNEKLNDYLNKLEEERRLKRNLEERLQNLEIKQKELLQSTESINKENSKLSQDYEKLLLTWNLNREENFRESGKILSDAKVQSGELQRRISQIQENLMDKNESMFEIKNNLKDAKEALIQGFEKKLEDLRLRLIERMNDMKENNKQKEIQLKSFNERLENERLEWKSKTDMLQTENEEILKKLFEANNNRSQLKIMNKELTAETEQMKNTDLTSIRQDRESEIAKLIHYKEELFNQCKCLEEMKSEYYSVLQNAFQESDLNALEINGDNNLAQKTQNLSMELLELSSVNSIPQELSYIGKSPFDEQPQIEVSSSSATKDWWSINLYSASVLSYLRQSLMSHLSDIWTAWSQFSNPVALNTLAKEDRLDVINSEINQLKDEINSKASQLQGLFFVNNFSV